jgi:phenylpropionate dioxygenase-like ring-hydroxylating dioxygenase large terminal subunit
MAETTSTRLDVPFEVDRKDRVRAERYYDSHFFELEKELLWPRVWQMATRLDQIPNPGDFAEYEILGRSVVVVRLDAGRVRAYENTCRHRGVKLASGMGNLSSGFECPFHGWCWNLEGKNTFVYQPGLFDPSQLESEDLQLKRIRLEIALGCAFINFDDSAPPLRDSMEPFLSFHEEWMAEELHAEWWLAAKLPVNWKLAMEAFMEGYHVMETHPQLMQNPPRDANGQLVYRDLDSPLPGVSGSRGAGAPRSTPAGDSAAFIDAQLETMKLLNVGMGGMTHQNDIDVAETLRGMDLSGDWDNAAVNFYGAVNDAITKWQRERGTRMPDLNDLAGRGLLSAVNFCFPHFFLLPTYASASSYRIRPLTEETCLFELWSLTRYPKGEEPGPLPIPTPQPPDHPQWPPIPAQDYSNLPIQQAALHNPSFKFMRLSDKVEGMIGNYQRLIDGYLGGLGYDVLLPAAQQVSGPIDSPARDLGF